MSTDLPSVLVVAMPGNRGRRCQSSGLTDEAWRRVQNRIADIEHARRFAHAASHSYVIGAAVGGGALDGPT